MVVDLTDPNRPRFTLQELRDVLQERNKLKSQLLVVTEFAIREECRQER